MNFFSTNADALEGRQDKNTTQTTGNETVKQGQQIGGWREQINNGRSG